MWCGVSCCVVVWCAVWCVVCVRPQRPRVYRHHAHMLKHMQEKRMHNKGKDKQYSSPLWTPMSDKPEEEYQDSSKPRNLPNKTKWKIIQDAVSWIRLQSGKPDLMPLYFTTLCHLTASNMSGEHQNLKRLCTRKFQLHVCFLNFILKEVWLVPRDDYFQRGSYNRETVADVEMFEIDLRVQGVPQKAVYQDEDRTKRMLKNQSNEKALITDLQKKEN